MLNDFSFDVDNFLLDKEENRITRISEQYVQFLFAYEIGSSDKWAYANDLGDGVVTIAGGVVIKGKGVGAYTRQI